MSKAKRFTALQKSMWAPFFELTLPFRRRKELEARVRELEDTLAVQNALSRYCYYYDSGNLDALISEVFTRDCVMVNPRGTYVGSAALKANYAYILRNKRFSFHNCHNVTVRIDHDGQTAGVSAFFTDVLVLPSGGLKASYGSYVAKLAKNRERWQICEMRITNNLQHRLAADAASDEGVKLTPTGSAPRPTRPANSREWIGADVTI
jgi:hypothetical protein